MINYEAILAYWHGYLNLKYFNGELEPVIIAFISSGNRKGIESRFIAQTQPFIIEFYDMEEEFDGYKPSIYLLTVLFHEMIHQYAEQCGIEDTTDGTHTKVFKEIAFDHGMAQDGYKLSEEIKLDINKHINDFNAVYSIGRGQE